MVDNPATSLSTTPPNGPSTREFVIHVASFGIASIASVATGMSAWTTLVADDRTRALAAVTTGVIMALATFLKASKILGTKIKP
jgi:cytochrome bd-type quinol oxidase subunit 1